MLLEHKTMNSMKRRATQHMVTTQCKLGLHCFNHWPQLGLLCAIKKFDLSELRPPVRINKGCRIKALLTKIFFVQISCSCVRAQLIPLYNVNHSGFPQLCSIFLLLMIKLYVSWIWALMPCLQLNGPEYPHNYLKSSRCKLEHPSKLPP